jgi:hypothetical protein
MNTLFMIASYVAVVVVQRLNAPTVSSSASETPETVKSTTGAGSSG